jgi:hypothetical protein
MPMPNAHVVLSFLAASMSCVVAIGHEITLKGRISESQHAIVPTLADCTLKVNGKLLKPVRVAQPWRPEYRAGEYRVTVDGTKVHGRRASEQQPAWAVASPDRTHWQWLAAHGDIAYFGAYRVNAEGHFSEYVVDDIRRIDLANGKLQKPLRIGGNETVRHDAHAIALIADKKHVVALSAAEIAGEGERKKTWVFRVDCWSAADGKLLWSKKLTSAGERPEPGAYLLAARRPDYAVSDVQHLSWLDNEDDGLVVCAGAVQPLLCFDRKTGKELWKVERVWEFERGFIGPSVWSHYIHRFGLDTFDLKNDDEAAKHRRQFESRFHCAIIGGPLVVRRDEKSPGRLFVAVSRAPAGPFSGYLGDCVLYEISDFGDVQSMVTLPRTVRGSQFRVLPDGVAWACQKEGLVRIPVSSDRVGLGFGPGGPDLITPIKWYRQFTAPERKAALSADKAGDPWALTDKFAYLVPGGGYVEDFEKPIYEFPITRVDLATGVERLFTLNVPYRGKLPEPTANFGTVPLPGGKRGVQARGPYLLAVTWLDAEDHTISAMLGMENWTAALTFDLRELPGK